MLYNYTATRKGVASQNRRRIPSPKAASDTTDGEGTPPHVKSKNRSKRSASANVFAGDNEFYPFELNTES